VEPKPVFDDPSFQASLSALDRGVGGEAGSESPPRRSAPPAPAVGTSAPVIPPIFPESALLPQPTAPVPRGVPPVPPPRPLLELFPQASGRARVREPRIGGTPSSLLLGREMPESVIDDAMITPAAADDDLPLSPGRRMARMVTLAVLFLMLMLAGAGAAAWVFRDEVSRLRSQWQSAPR
jgi:hypothetical protein